MKKKTKATPEITNDWAWPARMPNDSPIVTMLLDEAERLCALGCRAAGAAKPNPVAADFCFRNSWAMSVAGAWLRVKQEGQLLPESERPWTGVRYVDDVQLPRTFLVRGKVVTKVDENTMNVDGVLIRVPGRLYSVAPASEVKK